MRKMHKMRKLEKGKHMFINIGYGNVINTDKVVSIISPDSAPIKRLVQNAKESGMSVDATQGRRTRSVIITDSGHVVLSALLPDTIAERIHNTQLQEDVDSDRQEISAKRE